eukprot:s3_g19.t1
MLVVWIEALGMKTAPPFEATTDVVLGASARHSLQGSYWSLGLFRTAKEQRWKKRKYSKVQFLIADRPRETAEMPELGLKDRLQSYVPASGPGRCHALEIRRAINASREALQGSGFGRDELLTACRRWSILDFSEALEVVPRFGTQCSNFSFELHDLWQRSPRHVLARCSEREYLAFHCVCRRDQVLALQRGWRSLGEHALSVASEAQLLEALERLMLQVPALRSNLKRARYDEPPRALPSLVGSNAPAHWRRKVGRSRKLATAYHLRMKELDDDPAEPW